MTTLAPEPVATDQHEEDTTHALCCSEQEALCRADVSEEPFTSKFTDCLPCLFTEYCPRCGKRTYIHGGDA
ncbi:hypothetical protein [Streptomyces sp. NPDC001914]|uniref:hypothetical protein n=1 Tax=Streptomyces sp. NPDC001914 TaxID=3364623 RepID=UPI0036B10AE0